MPQEDAFKITYATLSAPSEEMHLEFDRAIDSSTGWVNMDAMPLAPIRAVGFSSSTAASRSFPGAASWAKGRLCGGRLRRLFTTSPWESKNQQC